ncbi:MAG: ABC transporter ATP-binding protein/permease, partial [Spirochaetaceae bacterium]|nr:ABC transporter ATP-binding protein/permease [Spirochaetaceae bacterium]
MRTILRYLKPYVPRMAAGLTIKFSGSVMDLLLPLILAHMIDRVVPRKDMHLVLLWGLLMAFCSFLALAGNVIANRMASSVARDATRTIRHDLFKKISLLSCAQINLMSVPSLVSRLSSDTYNVHRMLSSMQRMGVRAPILLLGGILMTMILEPSLALVLIGTLPFTFLVVFFVIRKGIPLFTRLQEAVDAMVRVVREDASGIRIIKALSKTEFEKKRFAQTNSAMSRREWEANMVMGVTNPAMFFFLNMGLVAVIIAGAYQINQGKTQSGVILAFLTYFTIILNATLTITRMFVMYSRGSASAERIAEALALGEDMPLIKGTAGNPEYHIAFENVRFTYPAQRELLGDISFTLRRGESLGLLGETGSGKSAILQLLLRFYDPNDGIVRIDGRDLRSMPPNELYPRFGVVFQQDVLFAQSVRENIAFGRELDDDEILRSLDLARAGAFVKALPQGMASPVSARGMNLSGGQRQRLLIARALSPPEKGKPGPEILILDDASSALDYRTDAELRRSLDEHFKNTTKIIVAQRISSIKHAEHIIVLEKGRIAGAGSHAELLDSCALYREIYDSQ